MTIGRSCPCVEMVKPVFDDGFFISAVNVMHPDAAVVFADEVGVIARHREVVHGLERRVPNRFDKPRRWPRPRHYRVANGKPARRSEALALNIERMLARRFNRFAVK